jgi:putative endonuclease
MGTSRRSNIGCYTYNKRPVELLHNNSFNDVNIAFEKPIKGWSRKKKEALIRENWEEMKEFAKCKNNSHYKNYSSNPCVSLLRFDYAQRDN